MSERTVKIPGTNESFTVEELEAVAAYRDAKCTNCDNVFANDLHPSIPQYCPGCEDWFDMKNKEEDWRPNDDAQFEEHELGGEG